MFKFNDKVFLDIYLDMVKLSTYFRKFLHLLLVSSNR